jgi:hypothetical protein
LTAVEGKARRNCWRRIRWRYLTSWLALRAQLSASRGQGGDRATRRPVLDAGRQAQA